MNVVLLENLLRAYQKHPSYGKPPLVVYDVDDILWSLMDRVCELLQIDYERATRVFSIRDNPELTSTEQKAILTAFSDPKLFENIQFYPGVENILRVEGMGARVKINSNAFNADIANFKVTQLLTAIPEITPEHIQINIINPKDKHKKIIDPETIIFVDDSEYNVALSPAIINLMPMHHPLWSTHPSAIRRMCGAGKVVAWRESLRDMIDYVEEIVAYLIKNAA